MDPVIQEVTIGRPRNEVFGYLADIANHAEFRDHYLVDWHLTREDTYGVGAGARFKIKRRFHRFGWGDTTITELHVPYRIVERGREGKYNRILTRATWELADASGGGTHVRYEAETKPKFPTDRLMEALAGPRWFKRKNGKALRRLRTILEEDLDRGTRVTVAGGARKPASTYRFRPDVLR